MKPCAINLIKNTCECSFCLKFTRDKKTQNWLCNETFYTLIEQIHLDTGMLTEWNTF